MEKSLSEKQLIVVVEGTASMGPYWKTIISDYLEKIIRIFCASKIPRQNLSDECLPELGLVVFNVHGPYSPFIVQQSGLTKDVDLFLRYLTTLPMSGGSFSEGAIAEGLAESLMMFSQNPDCHKHCILVAASNPYPFPTPISKPVIQNAENHDKYEVQIETCLSDAETVAKSFSKSFFSLSIISPRQLPKLQAIYNAGKHDSQSADPVVNNEKNPYFLILLSENFVEGCIALALPVVVNKQTDQRIVMMDGSMGRAAAHVQSISMSPQTHSTENEAIANQTILSEGNNIASIVKNMNPQNAEPSLLASSGFPHTPSIINSITQGGQIPSTSSASPPSLDLQEFRHIVNPSPQSLHPVGPPAHSNILNNLSRTHQVLASASITGGTSIELQTNGEFSTVIPGPNIITDVIVSSSVSRSGTVSKNVQTTQNTVTGSLTYSNSNLSPNLSVSSPLSNLQDNVGMNQSLPNIGQANIISGISGILQQSQHGLNSLAVNKPLQICTSGVQQLRPKYDKIWELPHTRLQ
ncbi:Mediator of RNA polymerase II transcription subunit 25 [Zostera marina]|uniref:Mediator of RNA polymerase II transcription subunit 25 n=1 Tax=Zostera marina TaxID=29655 RepID=A0A0K9PM57_ZOSMR|nr:Mediator of RNA polymerase II transcription subunit 25 [Zostera marina]